MKYVDDILGLVSHCKIIMWEYMLMLETHHQAIAFDRLLVCLYFGGLYI